MNDFGGVALRLLASVLVYRMAVSPAVRWSARRLGAAGHPGRSINGAYPERAATPRDVARAATAIVPLSFLAGFGYSGTLGGVYVIPATAIALVLWKCGTADFDVARPLDWQRADRLAALLICFLGILFPAASIAAVAVLCGRLGAWTHHSSAALRMVKATSAWLVVLGLCRIGGVVPFLPRAGGLSPADSSAALFELIGLVFLSHYVRAAHSKAMLGRRPWDWIFRNRTENLIGVAYAWGWARFVPRDVVTWVAYRIRPLVPLVNLLTMAIECAGLAAFTNQWAFIAAVAAAVGFNVIVVVLAGLLFWENMVIGCILAVFAAAAGNGGLAHAFGASSWLLSVSLLGAVLGGMAWRPSSLGWWDTPFVSRVYWIVHAASGERYGLYNNLMSPHEREFGRALGYPLSDRRMVTFSLGGVEDTRIRDALLRLAPDPAELDRVRLEFGECQRDEAFRVAHASYMQRFFRALNADARKRLLPSRLRWLKAPGGHLYYWGDLPAYRAQHGPAAVIEVRHQELLYSSARRSWHQFSDTLLFEIHV